LTPSSFTKDDHQKKNRIEGYTPENNLNPIRLRGDNVFTKIREEK
jgi:hypothetical protein